MRPHVSLLMLLGACGRLGFDPSGPAGDGGSDGRGVDGFLDMTGDAGQTREQLLSTALAYWKFNEGAGTTAADSTGNGHTVMLTGGGWGAGFLQPDGVDDFGFVPSIDLSGTAAVTVMVIVSRTYSAGPAHTLFELSTDTNVTTTGFGFFPDDTFTCPGGQILMFVRGNVDYNSHCYPQPTSGVTHQLIAIFDKSKPATETVLFVDGVEPSPSTTPAMFDNTNNFGAQPFYLFSRAGTVEFNAGQFDEMAVWARALNTAERALL